MWFRARTSVDLGSALAESRSARAMTQSELAVQLGVNRGTLITIEAGRNRAINRLVEAFAIFGYDIVLVPRSATVTVRDASAGDRSAR